MRILFICKRNETYGFKTKTRRSAGLWNSTRYIVESLVARGVQAEIIEVRDNNCIDREVTRFKPDLVVIEALWVVPEKFDVLKRLHPKVGWMVHMHSHMPFLALEGIAIEWLKEYTVRGVGVIANSPESYAALEQVVSPALLTYLPNIYLSDPQDVCRPHHRHDLHIGCFGAVRPLKNHLLQALAAIKFAREQDKGLRFYINATRVETNGDPVLKNLRSLFKYTPGAELVEVAWHEPEDFINKILPRMDICMQVSLSETFNVVTADAVTAGVPVVVSKEIKWASTVCMADDDDIDSIVKVMRRVHGNRWIARRNQKLLLKKSAHAADAWYSLIRRLEK